jgi:predicted dehydrogenase
MTGADPIDVGVAGLGVSGTGLAIEVQDADRATLAAIAEVDDDARQRAGDRFDVPPIRRYPEYDILLDATALDAVVIATPQGLHYDQLRLAFDHDLHVLCEKPLVTTASDSRDIVARDEAREELLMVGYQRHLQSAYVRARDRWAVGDARPRFVTAEITQDWTGYFEDGTNWRLDPERSGGGHLFNVGTHVVDAVLWTTGLTPESITADMTFYDEGTVDERASVTIRFENGSLAVVADTGLAHSHHERVHAWDERGTVRITATDWGPPRFEATDPDGETMGADSGSDADNEIAADTATDAANDADSPGRVDAFVSAIRNGSEPPATARDAHRTTAVLEAAYEAARRGERVSVEL